MATWGTFVWGVGVWGEVAMPESIQAFLASLTGQSGETATEIYVKWSGISAAVQSGAVEPSLEQLVRYHVHANGIGTGSEGSPQFPAKVAAAGHETLLGIITSGGAVGESVEQCLAHSGLLGWE